MAFLGLALCLDNWVSLLVMVVPCFWCSYGACTSRKERCCRPWAISTGIT